MNLCGYSEWSGKLSEQFEINRVASEELHDLRRRVLRSNDPAADVGDPRDAEATAEHYAGVLEGQVVVCASVYPSSSPIHPDLRTYQLRYMATDFAVQGRGLGAIVLTSICGSLAGRGVQEVWANGRDTALGFYQRLGWEMVPGSEHVSPYTQLPHTVIYKTLP
jgi:GNAT superfamily N-acetyltransferase